MQLTVMGKQIDTGAMLRRYVEARRGSILDKYFTTAIDSHVVVCKEAHLSRAEVAVHIHATFDAAAERSAKQMRRYKRRLRNHHAQARKVFEVSERARDYVLVPLAEEGEDGPAVVAEMIAEFRNRSHGELNLIYRRLNGNIGWADSELDPTRRVLRSGA